MGSINWIGVIWLAMWGCIFIGSTVMAIVEAAAAHRKAIADRKRKRRLRKHDRRALVARWWELTVG